MSGFSVTWLDLRESADFAARDKPLALRALQWLSADADTLHGPGTVPLIVDLGSGTGSTLRALTALGATNLVWRVVDHDPALLNEALRRHGKTHIIEDYEADLLAMDSLPLTGARLVSASALFDLASRRMVDELVARLAHHDTDANRRREKCGFYAALNYDGRTEWNPPHPLDAKVLAAFNQDQRRDKGLGPALGPESGEYLHRAFANAGFEVTVADSPWQLGAADCNMTSELIRGIAAAVAMDHGLDAGELKEWESFRLAHADSGTCTVGHSDILALPR